MKTITSLEGVEFLKHLNKIRKSVAGPLNKLNIIKALQVPPVLTGKETEEERQQKAKEQAKVNLDKLLDRILEEYPEDTIELIKLFCIPDEGETPDGLDYTLAAMQLITDRRVIDFLSSLMRSGLLNSAV